ncbi:MAG: hypothetical protein MJZ69_01595 [Bacteroidaceae bacterium]|nr:hypothetical protein [Bacteroidaceae bacterium]
MSNLIRTFFSVCANFLLYTGKLLHLSYEQMSVYVNLYLQGGLLVLSGFLPFCAMLVAFCELPSLTGGIELFCLAAYFSIYVVGFVALIRHYSTKVDYAFDLCVVDLQNLAGKMKISYHAVNILIFVIWWLALVGVNLLLFFRV